MVNCAYYCIFLGQADGKVVRVRPMLAHILANTLKGMLLEGNSFAKVDDAGVTVMINTSEGVSRVLVDGVTISFPSTLMGQLALKVDSVVLDDKMHNQIR